MSVLPALHHSWLGSRQSKSEASPNAGELKQTHSLPPPARVKDLLHSPCQLLVGVEYPDRKESASFQPTAHHWQFGPAIQGYAQSYLDDPDQPIPSRQFRQGIGLYTYGHTDRPLNGRQEYMARQCQPERARDAIQGGFDRRQAA